MSNARNVQFCKQPFEIIRGQIAFLLFVAFKNTVSLQEEPCATGPTGHRI